jgi:hypothetical protein
MMTNKIMIDDDHKIIIDDNKIIIDDDHEIK